MGIARLSTSSFDMHSPTLNPHISTSKLAIVGSSDASNDSSSLREDETYVLSLLTTPNSFGPPSLPAILPSHPILTLDPCSFTHLLFMIFLGSPRFRLPLRLVYATYSQIGISKRLFGLWATTKQQMRRVSKLSSSNIVFLRALVSYLVGLFNHVVRTCFPFAWSHHTIHLIHKSGPRSDPNNYRMIMVGHTFSKLYATILHMRLPNELDWGQAGWLTHQSIDHIFTLWAIIEEARYRSLKVYYCYVYFQKAFDSVSREALFQRLRDICISTTLMTTIMRLYECVLGRLRILYRMFDFSRSTIGVEQGCPLSPTLFGISIDELETLLHEHM